MSTIAYLDPATGSIIISGIVAGSAGIAVTTKSMMAKLRLGKRKRDGRVDIEGETVVPPN